MKTLTLGKNFHLLLREMSRCIFETLQWKLLQGVGDLDSVFCSGGGHISPVAFISWFLFQSYAKAINVKIYDQTKGKHRPSKLNKIFGSFTVLPLGFRPHSFFVWQFYGTFSPKEKKQQRFFLVFMTIRQGLFVGLSFIFQMLWF